MTAVEQPLLFGDDGPLSESASQATCAQRPEERQTGGAAADAHVPAAHYDDEWREVPQARFDSWSREMQLAYCAARDYDSAAHADSLEWCEFFLARARSYEAEMGAL